MLFEEVYRQAEYYLKPHLIHFDSAYRSHFQTDLGFLAPMMDHVHLGRGKRLRPMLHFLCQGLLDGRVHDEVRVAVLIELLHTASLIHDDVVDEADLRRNKETIHARWGNKAAVLIGDYLFADILNLGVQIDIDGVIEVVADTARQMGAGELRQTLRDTHLLPSESIYYENIEAKTASLFAATMSLSALVVPHKQAYREALSEFGRLFGMVFQIRDDILDFIGNGTDLGKPLIQDARDGKATLPVILAVKNASAQEIDKALHHLQLRNMKGAESVRQFVFEYRGIEDAQVKAKELAGKALALLESFSESSWRDMLMALVSADLERSR